MTDIKLRIEIVSVSKRQQPGERADNHLCLWTGI